MFATAKNDKAPLFVKIASIQPGEWEKASDFADRFTAERPFVTYNHKIRGAAHPIKNSPLPLAETSSFSRIGLHFIVCVSPMEVKRKAYQVLP